MLCIVVIVTTSAVSCGNVTVTNDLVGNDQAQKDYSECQYMATIAAARLDPEADAIAEKEHLVDECMQKKGYIVK